MIGWTNPVYVRHIGEVDVTVYAHHLGTWFALHRRDNVLSPATLQPRHHPWYLEQRDRNVTRALSMPIPNAPAAKSGSPVCAGASTLLPSLDPGNLHREPFDWHSSASTQPVPFVGIHLLFSKPSAAIYCRCLLTGCRHQRGLRVFLNGWNSALIWRLCSIWCRRWGYQLIVIVTLRLVFLLAIRRLRVCFSLIETWTWRAFSRKTWSLSLCISLRILEH